MKEVFEPYINPKGVDYPWGPKPPKPLESPKPIELPKPLEIPKEKG